LESSTVKAEHVFDGWAHYSKSFVLWVLDLKVELIVSSYHHVGVQVFRLDLPDLKRSSYNRGRRVLDEVRMDSLYIAHEDIHIRNRWTLLSSPADFSGITAWVANVNSWKQDFNSVSLFLQELESTSEDSIPFRDAIDWTILSAISLA
jgi:hypothetical protein